MSNNIIDIYSPIKRTTNENIVQLNELRKIDICLRIKKLIMEEAPTFYKYLLEFAEEYRAYISGALDEEGLEGYYANEYFYASRLLGEYESLDATLQHKADLLLREQKNLNAVFLEAIYILKRG